MDAIAREKRQTEETNRITILSPTIPFFSLKKLLLGEFKSGKIPLTTKYLDQEGEKFLLSFKRIRET